MTTSNPDCWRDGRTCPDCEAADHKQIELEMCSTDTDRAGIIWEKWQCPNCLYVEFVEIGEQGAT
jgi:hypothetical protein